MTGKRKGINKPILPEGLLVLQRNILVRAILIIAGIALAVVFIFSLTLAWQVNIADSKGLEFTASAWNFSGEVDIQSSQAVITPDSEGYIAFRISNYSSSAIAAGVTVDKSGMSLSDRQHIYFYVDGEILRNGETVSGIYINSDMSYTYTLLPRTERNFGYGAESGEVKWQAVSTVTGYYAVGTLENGVFVPQDYIKPLIYGFDPAHTTFKDDGFPLLIDGTVSAEEYIIEQSLYDGYPGQADPANITENGYYPIYTDENGNGVYSYLCTYDEILAGEEYFSAANATSVAANIRITGIDIDTAADAVSTSAQLEEALSETGISIVSLSKDITLENSIVLNQDSACLIDLNGHTLTLPDSITANSGAQISVTNGQLSFSGASVGIVSSGADIYLDGVTLNDASNGIFVNDRLSGTDSTVYIKNCEIVSSQEALLVYGNNNSSTADDGNSKIIIEGSRLIGEGYAGILCNGSYWGLDMEITDCYVYGYWTAIYMPQQDSTITVKNSTLEGYTGVAVKGGTVNIYDSTVHGTGDAQDAGYSQSGWRDTGDGIYVECVYEWAVEVNVYGNSHIYTDDANAYALQLYYEEEADAANKSINAYGGLYSSDVSDYVVAGCTVSEGEDGYAVIEE